jgi:Ca-activated chloride channel homolog
MIALLLLVTWSELWQSMTRATNSYAATARGVSQYARGKFRDAAASFTDADSLRHTPQTAFNLGTAQVATGDRERGSTTLAKAMRDPKLRADALYNRGISALASSAFDAAIRDFADVLRMRPNDTQAKRNLEIALRRKSQQKQQESGTGGQKNSQGAQPQPNQPNQPNKAPAPGDKQSNEPKGQTDAEALLRAVQQQEQEELSRMRRVRPEPGRVGW